MAATAVAPETEDATTPTVCPAVTLVGLKDGVNGRPESETNCGVIAQTVEVLVVTVKTDTAEEATGITDGPRPCISTILKLVPGVTAVTGPLSRFTGWPPGGAGSSSMRDASNTPPV